MPGTFCHASSSAVTTFATVPKCSSRARARFVEIPGTAASIASAAVFGLGCGCWAYLGRSTGSYFAALTASRSIHRAGSAGLVVRRTPWWITAMHAPLIAFGVSGPSSARSTRAGHAPTCARPGRRCRSCSRPPEVVLLRPRPPGAQARGGFRSLVRARPRRCAQLEQHSRSKGTGSAVTRL